MHWITKFIIIKTILEIACYFYSVGFGMALHAFSFTIEPFSAYDITVGPSFSLAKYFIFYIDLINFFHRWSLTIQRTNTTTITQIHNTFDHLQLK